jgi:transposase-like protein
MMAERGIFVAYVRVHRRTLYYAPSCSNSSIGASVRSPAGGMDKTNVTVRGQLRCFYRAIDSNGKSSSSGFARSAVSLLPNSFYKMR